MKKEIRVIDQEKKILRVTTTDERWYSRPTTDKKTGLPIFEYVPSSTWIAGCWPKGIEYYKWIAKNGWEESMDIMHAAGNKGSKVHAACEYLEDNGHLPIDMTFENHETKQMESLTTDELDCVMSYAAWWNKEQPQKLAGEMTVFGDGYAGTLDNIFRIAGRVWIVDKKTSPNIWFSMLLQISSYSHAVIDYKAMGITDEEWEARGLATLQLGYRKNKAGFKFTEIEDKFDLFPVAMKIWESENPEASVKERDYPLIITLNKGE